MNPIRILLVDDHPLVRRGLRAILDPDPRFAVLGEAATSADALRLVTEQQPKVVLLDLKLTNGSWVELCRPMLQVSPRTAIVALTAFLERDLVQGCLRAGARGYLLKEAQNPRLREQILTVVAGHVALDPRVADLLADELRQSEPPAAPFTPRELELLRLVAEGLTNREIGEQLGLSQHRVKGDMKRILAKLGAGSRVKAVLTARERGLI